MRNRKACLLLISCILAVLMVLCVGLSGTQKDTASAGQSDYELLARVISGEARGEPYMGKVAVGAVVMNRVISPQFPSTISGVIFQDWAFTSVYDGQINYTPDPDSYRAAGEAMSGQDPTYGALYFYNPARVTSYWIFTRPVTTVIGSHYFAR
ncbi:MAG: spore cortex-lytic enzyme SleB [Firmicutes bacterium]|jgi:N-acetylmuramoyl-L-alanine amidase|nr:spore cortex-lytic enzyme SleB [Bacillota bacterium]